MRKTNTEQKVAMKKKRERILKALKLISLSIYLLSFIFCQIKLSLGIGLPFSKAISLTKDNSYTIIQNHYTFVLFRVIEDSEVSSYIEEIAPTLEKYEYFALSKDLFPEYKDFTIMFSISYFTQDGYLDNFDPFYHDIIGSPSYISTSRQLETQENIFLVNYILVTKWNMVKVEYDSVALYADGLSDIAPFYVSISNDLESLLFSYRFYRNVGLTFSILWLLSFLYFKKKKTNVSEEDETKSLCDSCPCGNCEHFWNKGGEDSCKGCTCKTCTLLHQNCKDCPCIGCSEDVDKCQYCPCSICPKKDKCLKEMCPCYSCKQEYCSEECPDFLKNYQ